MKELTGYALAIAKDKTVLAVVLTGSLARGDYSGSSDADVLILLSKSSESFLDRLPRFMEPGLSVPVEPLVYTIAEFQGMLQSKNRYAREALTAGKALFERAGFSLAGLSE